MNGRAWGAPAHEPRAATNLETARIDRTSSGRPAPSWTLARQSINRTWHGSPSFSPPALLGALALALPATASAAAPCANTDIVPDAANMASVKTATLCLLNAERTSRGLSTLTPNGQLAKAAQGYSATMVRQRFFDHVSPSGSTLKSRVRRGTSYLRGSLSSWSLGENLGWGSGRLATPNEIHRAWMISSAHRRNILDRRFRHIGIGVVTGAPDGIAARPPRTRRTSAPASGASGSSRNVAPEMPGCRRRLARTQDRRCGSATSRSEDAARR